ncbi:P-loop containing nucleoside triphosphate hydrolase protein [Mytilinidion resinicola]|uniref:P-loop containing nucleoside triphosphate hydrolase protein n=1 Tax=Mytilinidion resinicola TaxID=574789 RepID=A0A6A6Y4I6_9PEZI|nr:P-loop containing nucleoside triphosphate hydrolase protein [Mytilinidion resinicola]KAF2802707.1 P-loop containing nucleoside triphosphate hydrolase protein [Mytilinidion resinicola]
MLLPRQVWALTKKNLVIAVIRRPISTFIRAFLVPLLIVLLVGYSQDFFSSDEHHGVGPELTVPSLEDALHSDNSRLLVGLFDNGFKNGNVSKIISSLSETIRKAGKTPRLFADFVELSSECAAQAQGIFPCFAGVAFWSSSSEPSSTSTWNYTIRSDSNLGLTDVNSGKYNAQTYMLPLQKAIDDQIVSISGKGSLPPKIESILFTDDTDKDRLSKTKSQYLEFCVDIFGAIFSFAMVGIIYHMTGFIAVEREMGVSQLIDSMIPGGSSSRARFVRFASTYISFTAIYLPSWLAVGIVIATVVFTRSSAAISIIYHLLVGLALVSFSLLGAVFFRKAQLSGSIMTVIGVVLAILPQVLYKETQSIAIALSLLFPTSNYTYYITTCARFELNDMRMSLKGVAPEDAWRIKGYLSWVFLIIQIFLYPVLAFGIEALLFGTASKGRKFATPADARAPTVDLKNFSKTYKPFGWSSLFKGRKTVYAVKDLDLKAYDGQILALLGPNGSGKSTTLNAIAGTITTTGGSISIDPAGGLAFAPQANVIWGELTVKEHIRIFTSLKSLGTYHLVTETDALIKACDLDNKRDAKSKTLSGGQKRKLQLAMMFAGGSAVCCVDEVSTGLDPISRRKIWDILLAERGRRTIIMTTHFLDEADFLADDVAIIFKGMLKAAGSTAALKSQYGNGYTVTLSDATDVDIPLSSDLITRDDTHNQTIFRLPDGAHAAELVRVLEQKGFHDYQVSGPTMEELFLKLTGETYDPRTTAEHKIKSKSSKKKAKTSTEEEKEAAVTIDDVSISQLKDGRPISATKQWSILVRKRFSILRRSWVPYFVAVAVAIVGAGIAPMLIKSYKLPLTCPVPEVFTDISNYRSDLSAGTWRLLTVMGPSSKIPDSALEQIANTYSSKYTAYPQYSGFTNTSELKDSIHMVETLDEFKDYVSKFQNTLYPGGIFMSDPPTLAYSISYDNNGYDGVLMQNMLNIIVSGVPISTGFADFQQISMPDIVDFNVLAFIIYFGLIMVAYPAFFALYPTTERIRNVRSMQYSNGVRPLPLWLSHLAFDSCFIIVISAVCTGLLSIATPAWFSIGCLFVVMLLYGITAALLSYVISMFAPSSVAAWALATFSQLVLYFVYFGGLIGIKSNSLFIDLLGEIDKMHWTVGLISPAVNLLQALCIGLSQFALLCHKEGTSNPAAITLYGGPILYLILQAIFLFLLLLWWDSGFVLHSPFARTPIHSKDPEAYNILPSNAVELSHLPSPIDSTNPALRVANITKRFHKNLAVDDVSFAVHSSSIYALLGPNGAGKSTLISLIRGDLAPSPSTPHPAIHVANIPALTHLAAARAKLGVCPQFDAADNLSVTETLTFFARIRGVADVAHNVAAVIAACGLGPWATQIAARLSGGTKRKLSLAVALVGNPAVLLLDEPSSALDASAKRTLWRTLQSVAKGRAVVLTTHSMEEADALADRIGIVSRRMLAQGTREEMRREAGDAYFVHVVMRSAPHSGEGEMEAVKGWVLDVVPGAKIERATRGGQVRFEVSMENAQGLGVEGLFGLLEREKDRLGVEFYSVGRATLDHCFVEIVRKYGGQEDEQ